MIELGRITYDSADSGPGVIEVLSEDDFMWIRIHKLGPETPSHRPDVKRDPELFRVFKLSNRNLKFFGVWKDRHIRR